MYWKYIFGASNGKWSIHTSVSYTHLVLSENRIPYQRDKTQDDRFFILTLFAIVKELEENPQIQPEDVIQVDLPIGLPPKHYAELCERYEAYFKRQGKIHDINYCGRTYHITIGEVMAFPPDYADVYKRQGYYFMKGCPAGSKERSRQ